MKLIFKIGAFVLLLPSLVCAAPADEYVLAKTVRVELPGLVQLVNKTTGCKVIGELISDLPARGRPVAYKVRAKHELCSNSERKEIRLQGTLAPSVEGRVMAGTIIVLVPVE